MRAFVRCDTRPADRRSALACGQALKPPGPLDIAGRNATGEVAADRRGGHYKQDDERLRREGLLRDHLLIRGQRQDSLLYALLCDR